jgi:hypothetical protein
MASVGFLRSQPYDSSRFFLAATRITVPIRMRHLFGLQQYIRIFFIVNITTYTTYSAIMAPKKENTKKVAGNAKVRQPSQRF